MLLVATTKIPLAYWGLGRLSGDRFHPNSVSPPPPPPPAGALTVAGGQILQGGSPFLLSGISVLYSTSSAAPATPASIRALYPTATSLMLALGADSGGYPSAPSNAAITAWVRAANAAGFRVGLSDYVPGQPQVRSGSDLTNSCNWYAALAQACTGLEVFWTTENEVGGTLDAMFAAVYGAIRGAGDSNLILMEVPGGNPGQTGGMSPSTFGSMHTVGWNVHFYPWAFTGLSSQADFDARAQGYVNTLRNFAQSADGVMPVVMGEGGNATSGNGGPIDDPVINGKFATVQATLDLLGKSGGLSGALFWLHDWDGTTGDADTLVVNGQLTQYGQQVATGFAAL
jgi:hypothetical protein